MSGSNGGAEGNPDFGAYGAPPGFTPEGTMVDLFAGAAMPTSEDEFNAFMMNMLREFLPGWVISPTGQISGPMNPQTGRAPSLGWVSPQAIQGAIPGPMTFDPISGYVFAPGVYGSVGKLNGIGLSHADRAGLALMTVISSIDHTIVNVNGQSIVTVVMTPDNLTANGWSFSPEPTEDIRGGNAGEGEGAGGNGMG